MTEKIQEKIEKLLALGASCNEHEAQLAMEKANQLMLAHNITADDILKEKKNYIKQKIGDEYFRESAEKKYIHSLLGKYFFVNIVACRTGEWMSGGYGERTSKKRQLELWGTQENVDTASYLYNFLSTIFVRLWKEHKAETGLDDTYRQSFYTGLYKGLQARLDKSVQDFQDETGLIVVKDDDLEQWTKDGGVTTRSKSRANYGLHAGTIEDGKAASSSISLSKGIATNGAKTTKLIGN